MKNNMKYFVFLFAQFLFAQSNTDTLQNSVDSVVVVNSNVKNEIYNSKSILSFFKKLDTLEQSKNKKVRIVHIGDSHIQADLFSGKMRTLLQSKFGNAGLGFTFPYNLAQTNGSHYIKYNSSIGFDSQRIVRQNDGKPVGLSGIALYTENKDFVVELNVRDKAYAFNSIKVISPLNSSFNLATSSKNIVLESSKPKVIFHKVKKGEALSIIANKYNCTVSEIKNENNLRSNNIQIGKMLKIPTNEKEQVSITKSEFLPLNLIQNNNSFSYNSDVSLDRIYLTSNENTTNFSLNGLVLENNNSGIVYSAIGVNGAKCSDYLKYPLFFEQLQALEADLVVISLGTNESFDKLETVDFCNQLKLMINAIKVKNPNAEILITTPPPSLFNRKIPNTFVSDYSQLLIKNAEENGYSVWDMFDSLGGLYSISKNYNNGLMSKDKVHYSKKGYEYQGEMFYNALMEYYSNYKISK